MKKFYYKKTVLQEEKPILQTLERSHTLLNALASDANAGEWHELPLRKKSTHLSDHESKRETISSTGSNDWSANSMVITDSDLASSWIYSRKRAAVNSAFESVSSDPITPTDGSTYPDPLADDIESPRVDFKRIPIAPNEESKSSCCCYMTVLLIIFICSFGILTSIGGVVYLEVFSTPRNELAADNLIANSDTMTTSVGTLSSPSVDGSIIGGDLNQEPSTDESNQGTSHNPDKMFQSRRGKSLDITNYQDDEITQSLLSFDPASAKTEDKLKNTEYQEDSSQSDQEIFKEEQISSEVSAIELDTISDTSKKDWSSSKLNTEQSDTEKSEDDLLYSTMLENVETVSSEAKSESKFQNEGDSKIEVAATDFNAYSTPAMATEIDPEVELESKLEIMTDNTLLVSDVEALNAHTEKHVSTIDTPTGRMFGSIQESIALVMKKFQRLESNTLPDSRTKDIMSTRRTLINTESSTVESDSNSEKQNYLKKIRKMLYDEKE